MRIYDYDGATGELMGERDARVVPGRENIADTDPAKFLVPANATTLAPPTAEGGHARVFVDGAWSQVADHRGETWFAADGREGEVDFLGDPASRDLTASPPPPPAPTLADFQAAIDGHVDAVAGARNYSSGTSCASYAASTVPQWQAEAAAFIAWRDAVWAHAYAELDKVENGQRPVPAVADFVAELPAIVWP